MELKSYKTYLPNITTFVFDVDGVFTDNSLLVTETGELLRTMNVKDGYAVKHAINMGYHVAIISAGTNAGVDIRFKVLGVPHVFIGVKNKAQQFQEYLKLIHTKPENVLYMGDDFPDYEVMQLVGLPTCPQDAVPEIKKLSSYISHCNGGAGAVRDVIEQVLKVQGKWVI